MTEPARSPAQWGDLYREQRRLYDSLSIRVQSLLVELLASEGITTVQVDARAKDVQSFVEKIGRRPGQYQDPLTDVTDLAGVRVIVYYASDVERVDALIEKEFDVDRQHSWRRTPTADPDRFGYRSDHYVVQCSASRADLGEWQPYRGLKAEIQVRTVLQHAWAAIDHRLNYKRASEIPVALKRQLFRISALLEVADDQFEIVRLGTEHLNSSYELRIASGDLRIPIDRASIDVYVERHPRAQRWADAALRAGFLLGPSPWDDDSEVDDHDGIAELTQASQDAGFAELTQLDQFLEEAESWGERAIDAMRTAGGDDEWWVTPAFVLASMIYIGGQLSLEEIAAATGGADFYIESLLEARRTISSS